MPDKSTESKPTDQSLQDEVTRLRSQVKELQEELSRREASADSSRAPSETSEVLRHIPDRLMGEASKIVRALTLASLEPLRLTSDIVDTFTEEVSHRTRPEERAAGRSRFGERAERLSRSEAMNLSRDIYSGFIKAVDRSLDIPSKVVDRLYSTYKEVETANTR